MSALLNKLQKDGSQLTGLDGKNSPLYDGQSQYQKGLEESQLDVGNIKAKYQFLGAIRSAIFVKKGLATSQLDLDGRTPSKYLDNPPR
jgi:hypothetical protein